MLIKGAFIASTNPAGNIFRGDIRIENGKIAETGQGLKGDDDIIDASGMAALPGFVNTHCHSPMSLLRGYADDLPLDDWLQNHVWPIEAKFGASDYYDGAMLSCAEMIRSGITSFADMYFHMGEVAKAVNDSGIKGVLAPTLIDGIGEHAGFNALKRFLGEDFGPRVVKSVSLHAPYSCSEETLMKGKEIAGRMRLQIHVAETSKEIADMKSAKGMSPVGWLIP